MVRRMSERRQTALGVARARFVEGLPRKAREVKASLALLTGTPDEDRPREELRRRLHALYASAQVFRIDPLANALKESLGLVDEVRSARRGFTQQELDVFANLAATLPALGHAGMTDAPSVSGLAAPPPPSAARGSGTSPGRSHAPTPMPRTHHSVETVVSVLVADAPEWQARVRAALPADRFEVMTASDSDEALRMARSGAPDVVLADRKLVLEPGADLVGRLREDPLTDFVPVILLLPPGSPLDPIAIREAGADEALVKPFSAETLLRTVARVTDTLAGPRGASTLTGDLTVEEIADRVADEVKRGLVEAAAKGKDLSIPVGDGTSLMAATWSAIGHIRAHVAERSGGRVRFREGPQRGGPAFVTVSGEDAPSEPIEVDLAGRRALVVDDDPAVVWFFAGLLREQGADVYEADDGCEALERARRDRPDLVISDILMPRLDGFGLTRAMKRDPQLADVPVILLSWKEDFLQRMRQLKAGASGYLRKEAGSAQILTAVRDVLRPRARLESRLKAGGDVRGRLEDVGIQTLLTTVSRLRPDARLTLRDASSLYEVDLRDGELVDLTRTASDGAFARGHKVLDSLFGTTAGRFTVVDDEAEARRIIDEPLSMLLASGMTELAARVDAVSGKNLSKAASVDLDEEALDAVLRASPEEVERVVKPLRAGTGPRALMMDGEVAPEVLESVLVDLARQGAIRRVFGPDGEDRIALAREAREKGFHPELSEHEEEGTLSWLPTAQTTEEILLEAEQMAANAGSVAPEPIDEAELQSLRPPPVPQEARTLAYADLEPPTERARKTSDIEALDEPFDTEPASIPPDAVDSDETTLELDALDGRTPIDLDAPHADDTPTTEILLDDEDDEEDETELADGADAEDTLDDGSADDASELAEEDEDEGDDEGDEGDDEYEDEGEDEEDEYEDEEDEAEDEDAPLAAVAALDDPGATLKVPPSPSMVEEDEEPLEHRPIQTVPPAAPVAPESGGMGWVGWTLVALILGAVGFVGYRLVASPDDPEVAGPVPPEAPTETGAPPDEAPPPEADTDETEPEETVVAEPSTPDLPVPYGREEAGIAELPGVSVAAGEGLVVIEPSASPMTVRVGERELEVAGATVGLPLAPGVHHLTYVRGDNQDFIWVAVREGHTRFVPAP